MRGVSIGFCSAILLSVLSTSGTLQAQPAGGADKEEGEMTFDADEAVVDKKPGGKKDEPPPEDTTPPSSTLVRGNKLYDKGDYFSASIELAKVVSGETNDSPANKQRAEFYMGKTLYKLEFYAASLGYFDRIVEKRTGHRYFMATLPWLAQLSRVLPDTSEILAKIGEYNPDDLTQPTLEPVRDELYFLLGKHFYKQGSFEQAIDMFGRVAQDSPFYVKAAFFEGVTYVLQYKGQPALDSFKKVLRIVEDRPKLNVRAEDASERKKILDGAGSTDEFINEYRDLAYLQMARVFYSTQDYEKSIKYYEKLEQSSPDWVKSLFEASWAYYFLSKYSKGLGNIHTLNAPYFENEFFPESWLLKAVMYFEYCQYDRALEAVAEYNQTFGPLRDELKKTLDKHQDDAEFYSFSAQVLDGKAGLPEKTQRLIVTALNDRTLAKTFAWVDELDTEIKALGKADRAWQTTSIATEVLQELNLQKSLAEASAGKLARERIKGLEEELRKLTQDGRRIRIEVLNRKADAIAAKVQNIDQSSKGRQEAIVVDDEHFLWKFNGEYWKDELGYYRFKVKSQCPKRTANLP